MIVNTRRDLPQRPKLGPYLLTRSLTPPFGQFNGLVVRGGDKVPRFRRGKVQYPGPVVAPPPAPSPISPWSGLVVRAAPPRPRPLIKPRYASTVVAAPPHSVTVPRYMGMFVRAARAPTVRTRVRYPAGLTAIRQPIGAVAFNLSCQPTVTMSIDCFPSVRLQIVMYPGPN